MMALATTIGLGAMFLGDQYLEYNELPFTITDSPYGSTFYLTTGFHGMHVLLGAIWLAVTAKMYNRYKSVGVGMKGAVLYWWVPVWRGRGVKCTPCLLLCVWHGGHGGRGLQCATVQEGVQQVANGDAACHARPDCSACHREPRPDDDPAMLCLSPCALRPRPALPRPWPTSTSTSTVQALRRHREYNALGVRRGALLGSTANGARLVLASCLLGRGPMGRGTASGCRHTTAQLLFDRCV